MIGGKDRGGKGWLANKRCGKVRDYKIGEQEMRQRRGG